LPSTGPKEQEQGKFRLSDDLILVGEKAASREELLGKLAGLLGQKGYVKESFLQALLEREKAYPTGLQTSIMGVAIPHTDTEHVVKPALAIATLKEPLPFRAMDNPQKEIPVELVIVMAIKEPSMQLKSLQKIMEILQDEKMLSKILQAQNAGEILAALEKHFADEGCDSDVGVKH